MGKGRMSTGRAVLGFIVIAVVLWVAFRIGALVVQMGLGLLALGGLVYLLWKVFFAKK